MSLISSGSSRAIWSVGSSLISSSEARSIKRTSQALASSSRERSRRARGPRIGVMRLRSQDGPVGAGGFYRSYIRKRRVDWLSPIRGPLRRSPWMADLIPLAQARGRVLEAVRVLPAEPVVLGEALGRVLAEDVSS